jgi:four helix bundle protein
MNPTSNIQHPTPAFIHFLSTAQGSLAEVQTQIEIAGRLKYLSAEQIQPALEHAESLARQLNALRSALTGQK